MHLIQVHHSLSLHRLLDSPFRKFELSIWLHVFARSLISIFIPIFLLLAGYSIGEVMIYYFIYNVIDVPFNFIARWLTRKIGARMAIILGSVFMLLYFISLSFLNTHSWAILIMIAFFAAMYDVLYWVAHLYFFVKCLWRLGVKPDCKGGLVHPHLVLGVHKYIGHFVSSVSTVTCYPAQGCYPRDQRPGLGLGRRNQSAFFIKF